MQKIRAAQLEDKASYLLYIHTPFCGTCHIARSFLETIEETHKQTIFYEMNASLDESFMQQHQIESVPCLLIQKDDEIKEKIYTFHSIGNIYHYLLQYERKLFQS